MADVEKDIVLRVKSETDQATGQFKNLKQELRSIEGELNKMATAGQTGTDAFKKLQQRAGEVKDQIGDTKAAIKALSSDTFKLDAFTQAAQGIAGGFAAAQGAMALFGSENKQVEEAIKKTQGAMALLQGVTAITNILQKETAFSQLFLSKAQKDGAVATDVATKATKGFGMALKGLGIGLLIGALTYLIANFEDVKKVVNNLLKPFDGIIAKVRDFLHTISFGLIDDSATAKTKDNAEKVVDAFNKTKDAMKESEKVIERQIELAKAQGKSTKEIYLLEKQLADLRLKNLQAEQSALKTKEKAGTATEDEKKRLKELVSEIADANNKRLILDANYQKAVADANKKAKEKAEADAKKEREEKAKKDAEIKKQQEQNAKDFQERTNKEFEDSKKASDDYYDHLINVAKVNGQSTEELELQKLQNLLQIQKDYGQSTIALEDQIALKKKEISDKEGAKKIKDFEKAIADDKISLRDRLNLNKQFFDQKLIDEKTYNENAKKLEDELKAKRKEAFDYATNIAQKSISTILALRENQMNEELRMAKGNEKEQERIRKEYFERNKKVQVAEAIIQAVAGAQGAFAQTAKSPITTVFPAAPYIAAATALATGLANVQKIRQSQYQGGSASSSSSNAPNLSPSNQAIQTSGLDSTQLQLDAQGNLLQQRSVRTYVLETDISAKQQRSKRLQQTATLGK